MERKTPRIRRTRQRETRKDSLTLKGGHYLPGLSALEAESTFKILLVFVLGLYEKKYVTFGFLNLCLTYNNVLQFHPFICK
jgi:hypothetical protein